MPETRRQTATLLRGKANELAQQTTNLVFDRHPDLTTRYGPEGKAKCLQDTLYHFSYLTEAVGSGSMELFSDYVLWAQQVLQTRNLPVQDLHLHLTILKEVLAQNLPINQFVRVANHLNHAIQLLEDKNGLQPAPDPELTVTAQQYLDLLLAGKRKQATDLILQLVESGTPVREIYLTIFQPVQHQIGRLWQRNKISVAQEHFCTAITQSIISQLYLHIFGTERNGYKLLATCVSGDLHEIGLRMVADFFEMEGWDTYYLGANVPVQSIISALKDQQSDLLLLSATMTFHVRAVEEVIKAVKSDSELQEVKIMVGGYPFNTAPDLWKEIGADGFSANAQEALAEAMRLVTKNASMVPGVN